MNENKKNDIFISLYLVFLILIIYGMVFFVIYLDEQDTKNTETTYSIVTVTIVDVRLNERTLVHPIHKRKYEEQKYQVIVKYNGVEYYFYGKELYDKYKGQKTANATLKTEKYKSGSIKNQRIISLGGYTF